MAQSQAVPVPARFPWFADLLRSPAFWCLVVVVVAAARYITSNPGMFLGSLDDTDNATRLVEVRQLLSGGAWFDMTLPQLGYPDALYSHWSRLIDAPLAVMIAAFTPLLGTEGAETATRLIWPSLMLFAMAYLTVREAEREAGLLAGVFAAALIVAGPFALFQFVPGRIDHHNAQLLFIAGGLILMPRALREPRLASVVGAMLGVGLAVGYEALVLTAGVLGLAALFACFDVRMRAGFARISVAGAVALGLCFVALTAPSRWFDVACDALGLNLVLLVGSGALAAWALNRFAPSASPAVWFGGLAVGGAVGLGFFGAVEPSCLAGPLANIDPRVKPIWLDHIIEAKSLFAFAASDPKVGVAYGLITGMTSIILFTRWRAEPDTRALFALTLFIAAAAYGCIYVRLMPYAIWVAMPVLAVWMATLPGVGETPARTVRLAALVFLNQSTILLLSQFAVTAVTGNDASATAPKAGISGCEKRDALRSFGRQPPGLVLSDIDLGPHIAAHGPHRVMAAPYHRLDQSIILVDRLLKAQPAKVETELRQAGVRYVVLCAKDAQAGAKPVAEATDGSFQAILRAGGTLPYLEPIELGVGDGKLRAWRLRTPAPR